MVIRSIRAGFLEYPTEFVESELIFVFEISNLMMEKEEDDEEEGVKKKHTIEFTPFFRLFLPRKRRVGGGGGVKGLKIFL